ncbi:MAG: Ppx/GppA family phosphatase [Vicinamibacteraceae bacterium]|nr:Ppx/GppA family phosphatase [Vicinamibacteraceae bacterium]
MRLAAIDIGTNSVHMIVVQVRPDLSFEVIDREKEMVRLGAGGLDGRRLTDAAMTAALEALAKFRRLADSHGVDEIIAGATSATREAENGGEFLATIASRTGIEARVVSGPEEARLIHLAAGYGVDLGKRHGVVIDIGGGSVEITLGPPTAARLARSFKAGVIRLTERFVKSDPLEARDERRLVKHIKGEISDHIAAIRRRGFSRVVGTSGTILSLGALAAADEGLSAAGDLRNLVIPSKAVHRLRKRLVQMDQKERLELPGLDPRRADLSVAGAVLFDTILTELGASEFALCDLALREGLVLDYIQRNRGHIAKAERYPDIRRRSVIELAEKFGYNDVHSRHVSELALSLFDALPDVHGLGAREREWLEYAAALHDIGMQISHEDHHKHAYYLVKHGGLRGFDPGEIEVLALLARAHRTGRVKKSHGEFAALPAPDRRAVRALSAILTVAEGLDRSHAQQIARIELERGREEAVLHVTPMGDAELEAWAAGRHLGPLAKLLGVPVRLQLERVRRSKTASARPARRRKSRPRLTHASSRTAARRG